MRNRFRLILTIFIFSVIGISIFTCSVFADDERAVIRLNRVDTTLYPTNFLNVTVMNKDGKPLEDLKPENFEVFEEGKPQKVLKVAQSDEQGAALNVVLVIDCSGSMNEAMDDTKEAAKAFLQYMAPGDKVALVSFSDTFILEQPFTQERSSLESAIDSLKPRGGTALFISTGKSVEMFDETIEGNKAVVVLTDGRDSSAFMKIGLQDCIDKSQDKGVPIFTIGLGSGVDQNTLRFMAEETGGMFRYAPDTSELEDIYKSLANVLKKQLWVQYAAKPEKYPKTSVNVSVRLKKVAGAGMESRLSYRVPVQWWKSIAYYVMVEVILIVLCYFLFRLFWKNMNMDPVVATRLAIVVLIFLTLAWYVFSFIRIIEPSQILWFVLAGVLQLILLIIPIKVLAK